MKFGKNMGNICIEAKLLCFPLQQITLVLSTMSVLYMKQEVYRKK